MRTKYIDGSAEHWMYRDYRTNLPDRGNRTERKAGVIGRLGDWTDRLCFDRSCTGSAHSGYSPTCSSIFGCSRYRVHPPAFSAQAHVTGLVHRELRFRSQAAAVAVGDLLTCCRCGRCAGGTSKGSGVARNTYLNLERWYSHIVS